VLKLAVTVFKVHSFGHYDRITLIFFGREKNSVYDQKN